MFGGKELDAVALSDGGGAGWACAGELNGERTPSKNRTAIAVPKACFLKNSIFIIKLLSI